MPRLVRDRCSICENLHEAHYRRGRLATHVPEGTPPRHDRHARTLARLHFQHCLAEQLTGFHARHRPYSRTSPAVSLSGRGALPARGST